MITLKLNEHIVENAKAVEIMRKLGFSEEEIQAKVDKQNEIDEVEE